MIAIIDSGSTKADWAFTDGKKVTFLNSLGMNPNFINGNDVIKIVNESILKNVSAEEIQNIYYFGTGCSGNEQKKVISDALKELFKNADIIVDHDIKGAVIATCGNEEGIACIIGTGSNSIYFDGSDIHENNYGLGYILADEGAGTYLGKKLITNYLYRLLPDELSESFNKKYKLSRNDVIKNVYNNPTANTWLGSFAEFYSEHMDNKWITDTVKNGFMDFIQLFVMNFHNYQKIPVHFVGSIAYNYKNILEEIAAEKNFKLGKVIKKPIDGLVNYYNKKVF